MLHFCTYFDRHYLSRALALHQSLRAHCAEFHLYALCFDEESFRALHDRQLADVTPIRLEELEQADEALPAVRSTRSRLEYYFTCTPLLPLHLLASHPEIEQITYLDADLYFYGDPQQVMDEIGSASIALIPHRFPAHLRERERFGRYNVGWLTFRRDENGLACLRWWRDRCLEWCYARAEEEKYADQKYLDHWPRLFAGVHEIAHTGANVGPWNLANHRVRWRGGQVCIGEQPLVFFHFSSLQQIRGWLVDTRLRSWRVRPSLPVRRRIIEPYLQALSVAQHSAHGHGAETTVSEGPQAVPVRGKAARLIAKAAAMARIAAGVAAGNHLLVVRGRVL